MKIQIPAEITAISQIQELAKSGFSNWSQFGYVNVTERGDLLLFDYNTAAHINNTWPYFERVCRGLIINKRTGEIVARPFDKFFYFFAQGRKVSGHIVSITEKLDGCFRYDTAINCWDGTTLTIRDIVRNKLTPTLIGMDEYGNIVPCEIIEHFDNGVKENWLSITVNCPVSKKSGGANWDNVIRVTTNHHIYVNGQYQPAENIKVGDIVLNYEYVPSDSIIHMVESSLLGDGSIVEAFKQAGYQELHKIDHLAYVESIRQWLGECVSQRADTTSGYGTQLSWASSKKLPAFRQLREKWYPNGRKQIPQDLSWMDDFSVAKWYMDDGSLSHHPDQQDRANFATNGFSKDEVDRLAQRLEEMYSVSCTVYNSKGWAIRVNAGRKNEIDRMWQAIAPHIVGCMRYKLPERYQDVPYIPYLTGKLCLKPIEVKVLSVEPLEATLQNFPAGRKGFDIRTTTGNYFAKGILVHNSLGIHYRHKGEILISTKGSFFSPQARWATKFLNENFDLKDLGEEWTLLFEIIYPDNRIVVNYENREDLVLLAARNRFTGEFMPFFPDMYELAQKYGFSLPQVYTYNTVEELIIQTGKEHDNFEGWVVEFSDGQRVKFKTDRYVEIHRYIRQLDFPNVLKAVQSGDINYITRMIPEDMLGDVYRWIEEIQEKVEHINAKTVMAFMQAPRSSKAVYKAWAENNHPELEPYLMRLYEGKAIEPLIYELAFQEKQQRNE